MSRVDDPEGGFVTLGRTELPNGQIVTVTTALNRGTTYRTERLDDSTIREAITYPDGTQQVLLVGTDGSRRLTATDGTVTTTEFGPDPRFGLAAPIARKQTVTTPDALTLTVTRQRDVSLADPSDLLSLVQLVDTTMVNGSPWTSSYQAGSHTFTLTSPAARTTTRTIDTAGRLVGQQAAALLPIQYTYDGRGGSPRRRRGPGRACAASPSRTTRRGIWRRSPTISGAASASVTTWRGG
ncbi:MAG: hypothetical protein U0232_28050 [Thermomicrobiales bacterium]